MSALLDSQLAAHSAPPVDEVRSVALQICTIVQRGDASLEHLLDRELRGELPEPDKQHLYAVCTGVFRWMAKLDWVLNGFYHGEFLKCLPQMKNALRIALYEILYMPNEPPDDAIAFAGEYIMSLKGGPGAETATGVLSHIANSRDHIRYPDRKDDLFRFAAVTGSHPWWLAKRWVERFGEAEGMKLLLANNETMPITFRVNKLRGEVKIFLDLLTSRGINFTPLTFNDTCVAIPTIPQFANLNTYKKGLFTPYTASDALAVALLNPQPDESILVFCAGTSGKTSHIAEVMLHMGKITAVDRIDTATSAIRKETQRLGITIVSAATADPLTFQAPIADRIVVDAPNSRIGMASAHPGIKWKLSSDMLLHYANQQVALLSHAAQFVKPGGALLYTTQSTEPEENQDVVRRFLATAPKFAIDPPGKNVPREFVTVEGFVQSWSHRHRIEGSFAVRFVRN